MTNTNRTFRLRAMIECAIMVALATVLSTIKLYEAPFGGSVTLLSMLPVSVLSIRLGLKWGITGGFLYARLQMFLDLGKVTSWGLTPAALIGCIIFDYLLAFTVIGLAGLFRKRGRIGMIIGIALAMFLRFCSHLVSGTLIFDIWLPDGWANPFVYSVAYNGAFMLPELIFTVVAVIILTKTAAFRQVLAKSI
ncbi:MAG: energy-coupled thiamine transporter ThiT [Clostridia bacterium]|nr:energy-coupled thiamine transporter ThiT [Clostridia bacterium]